MTLEEMRTLWAAQDEKIERSIRLNERVLQETVIAKTRSVLARFVCFKAIGLAVDLILIVLLGWFMSQHTEMPRFFVAAGTIHVFLIWMAAAAAVQLTLVLRLEFSGPVTAIQRDIERAKLVEYRMLKWTVLASFLIWVPILIVAVKAFLDFDLFVILDPYWVMANVVLGAVVIAIGQWLSQKFVEPPHTSPWARRLIDHVSGRRLATVTKFLGDLEEFERERS